MKLVWQLKKGEFRRFLSDGKKRERESALKRVYFEMNNSILSQDPTPFLSSALHDPFKSNVFEAMPGDGLADHFDFEKAVISRLDDFG